jgi:putative SOS response-associated peptidase YedK
MCGRYGVQVSGEGLVQLAQALLAAEVRQADDLSGPWGEVRPTDLAPVLLRRAGGGLAVEALRWGVRILVPRGAEGEVLRETLVINARAETARGKRSFRHGARVLIPATGWTEWPAADWQTSAGQGAAGQPAALGAPDGRVLWFAGLSLDEGGASPAPGSGPSRSVRAGQTAGQATSASRSDLTGGPRFVIVTRPPVDAIASVHDRMPAVVDGEAARSWLAGEMSPEALVTLSVHPAPAAAPVGPARPRQLSLL